LYCARHDYGTYAYQQTGNVKLVMDAMGHADVPTAMKYRHPELVREALNARHILRHTGGSGNSNQSLASD
jgi:integrase